MNNEVINKVVESTHYPAGKVGKGLATLQARGKKAAPDGKYT